MASIELSQPILGRITGLPKPNPKPEDKYRFYACELKWNAWVCSPTTEQTWKPSPGTITTSLVPVLKQTPQFLDPFVIAYKVRKPVLIHFRQNQN